DSWTLVPDFGFTDDDPDRSSTLMLTRVLENQDFRRFDYYASRMIKVSLAVYTFPINIHASVYESLVLNRSSRPFLPKLRTCSISVDTDEEEIFPSFLLHLLSPTVSHIKLHVDLQYEKDITPLIPLILFSLPFFCPRLQFLSGCIFCSEKSQFGPFQSSFQAIVPFLDSLNALSFSRPTFDAKTICEVSRLPKLRKWEVELDDNVWSKEALKTTQGLFPALASLKLTAPTFERAAELINFVQVPLEDLELHINPRNSRLHSFTKLSQIFSNHSCTLTLTSLILDISMLKHRNQDVCAVFQPFFALRRLITFSVTSLCVTQLDDVWLADAAIAWPHLQNLILWAYRITSDNQPKATCQGLISLVRRCPNLSEISITITANPVATDVLDGACNTIIRRIHLGGSRPKKDDLEGVYRTFLAIFPNLETVDVWYSHKAWKRINDLLRLQSQSRVR
ncbi:hypothetical protein H0H93_011932, partial [Arthromyces matolae]